MYGVMVVAGAAERVDPVGTWSCIVFGHPRGDERIVLRADPNGDMLMRRTLDESPNAWQSISTWNIRRDELTFSDFAAGREYTADLSHSTLGGRWADALRRGGWWCLAAGNANPRSLMPPLIPELMATPWYPRQAIRLAKEGSAVACFTVDSSGRVVDPTLIELSDEVFRNPTLSALQRSRYEGWSDAVPARPACRSFSFELESIYR